MSSELQVRVAEALLRTMMPLARTLVRFGVSCRELDQLARRAYVEVATRDYGIRGRPTNISRVAAMTGLSRKEVHRIRSLPWHELDVPLAKRNRAAELLHHWYTDPAYLAADGQPRLLPYAGDEPSFVGLVRRTGGDLSPAILRRELSRAGAVETGPDGSLRALKRDFVPSEMDAKLLEGLQFGLRGLLETILFNSTPGQSGGPRFQREVHCDGVPTGQVAEVRSRLREALTRISERLDNTLSSAEDAVAPPGSPMKRVSVGLYYFERHPRE
jgi:hypothetical protein